MDIELLNVQATSPLIRSLASDDDSYILDHIETHYGTILVAKQGADHKQNKPVILTYHDIGLNHVSNFQAFFNYMDMRLFLQSFAVIHVNAPGQEENAAPLPESFVYPTMDQLAEQIEAVCKFYGLKNFIGLGVGAGANILSRFALRNPSYVDGLFLVNCTASQSSWSEYIYQKMNVYYLNSTATLVSATTFPQSVQDYLLWYHFGRVTEDRNRDLIEVYRKYFSGQSINPKNLSLFIDSYIRRTDLGIVRGDKEKNFKSSVLLLCANLSPHVDDTVNMNSRLNPENSTWMKLSDSGMALEEQPGKVAEAMRLFIQGLGYALTVFERRRSSLRKMSLNSSERPDSVDSSRKNSIDQSLEAHIVDGRHISGEVHIVENPIAQC